ncbi:hypothetical protein [Enterobacter asburiae]|uniref:hypothetical protein n=1 Tax=Enterobacter asburiae TaxID=61645 RepID=UPI00301B8000
MSEERRNYEHIEKWEELINQNFHRSMVDAASSGAIETHSVFDKFSSWMLVGCGATAALMIVNIDKIIPYISTPGLRYAIVFLTLSACCGFVAKYFEINASISEAAGQKTATIMKARVSEYEEAMKAFDDLTKHTGYQAKEGPTYEEFAESFIGLFPYNFLRKKLRQQVIRKQGLPEPGNRKAIHAVVHQSIIVCLQAAFYILFLLTIAYSINLGALQ